MRPYFVDLADKYEESLKAVLCAAACSRIGVGMGARFAFRPARASARLRVRTAIFLDQMSRNIATVRGDRAPGMADLRSACDAVAVSLALSVLSDVHAPRLDGGFLALGTPAELCFLSLVLRHTRRQPFVEMSANMLRALSAELALPGGRFGCQCEQFRTEASELCGRFVEETEEVALSLTVEPYLTRALTEDEPEQLRGPPPPPSPRTIVLDAICQDSRQQGIEFLSSLLDDKTHAKFLQHQLVEVLRLSLQELGLLSTSCGIVLSLSGGVDSMVTNCLLWLLHKQLPPEQRFRWCAMHLCHPNRQDSIDEEKWVRMVCDKLGVALFTYRPEIRRPHGNVRTGISRERYEEKSKEIRFRMYSKCIDRLNVQRGVALVVHHQDDADENRLAELGKGNILHIDGMSSSSRMLGVEVVRPLLAVRKAELLAFAQQAHVCYMLDSTPKWSRRGWTRRLLDGLESHDAGQYGRLLTALTRAGALSESLGDMLDASLQGWLVNGIVPGKVQIAGSSVSEVSVVLLWLPEIVQVAVSFEDRLGALCADFADIAQVWNAAIAVANAGAQAGFADDQCDADAGKMDGDLGNDEDDAVPGACPLQPITVSDGARIDAGPFLLGRAICAASNRSTEVQRLLRGQLAARRALTHLWDCIARARRSYQWGTLHKRCPCLYLRDTSCLVLYDIEDTHGASESKAWQYSFAASAGAFAQRQQRPHPSVAS